jgi:hypothetical protein
MKLIQ